MRWALVAVYATTALAAALPAAASLRRRRLSPYAVPLAVTLLGISEWSLAQALATAAPTVELATLATYGIYPGVCTAVFGFVQKSVMMVNGMSSLSRRTVRLLLIEPAYVAVSVVTDPWTHGFYRQLRLEAPGTLVIQPGPLYWIHTAYSYLVLTLSMVLVMRALLRAVAGHRRAFVLFLVGSLVPVAANATTLFQDVDAQSADLTPVAFLITVATWGIAERGASLTRFAPVAYQHVIAALTDAVMVLDNEDRILDGNPAAARLSRPNPSWPTPSQSGPSPSGPSRPEPSQSGPPWPTPSRPAPSRSAPDTTAPDTTAPGEPTTSDSVKQLLGRLWREAVIPELATAIADEGPRTVTVSAGQILEVRSVPVLSDYGQPMGRVVVCRDVTELERLRADLVEQANRDPLTGIPNRRYLTEVLREAADHATGRGEPLTVIMIDIDHFKRINDRYGHAAGDRLLEHIATRLASTLRSGDTVARYGGEEFVVVMPGATVEQASRRAEAWRRECEATRLKVDGNELSVTISAGVAGLSPVGDAERMLRLADEALYAAKAAGRNRVVVGERHHPATLAAGSA